jgi:hypothetical protein
MSVTQRHEIWVSNIHVCTYSHLEAQVGALMAKTTNSALQYVRKPCEYMYVFLLQYLTFYFFSAGKKKPHGGVVK